MSAFHTIDFTPGTVLVLEHSGLATVVGQTEEFGAQYIHFEIASGGSAAIPLETLREYGGVRALVGQHVAARWLAMLRDTELVSDDRPFRVRTDEHTRALANGSGDDLVRSLRRLYASRYAASAGDRELITMLEERIIPELAHVLGVDVTQLIAELHGVHATFSASAAARPEEAAHHAGTFSHVDGQLIVGDPVGGESWTGAAARGRWNVYIEDQPTFGLPSALVAIHVDAVGRIDELRGRLQAIDTLYVRNGAIGVFDLAARRELGNLVGKAHRRIAKEVEDDDDHVLEQVKIVHDRGIVILTSRGTKRAAVAVENGVALLVVADIGFPQTLETGPIAVYRMPYQARFPARDRLRRRHD
jgi:RNA polymerase-interacting CarD/CdnL/TRCF family regulator